ncbi:MAG: autotransporter domain-containing protein, partial [Deltaproteobacteria bacterium]|nr:autotransporter domain-containing protein [Deltaproteobacteria bacterium]
MKGHRGFFSPGHKMVGWAGGLILGLVVFALALVGGVALAAGQNITIDGDTVLSGNSNDKFFVNATDLGSDLNTSQKVGIPNQGFIVSGGKNVQSGNYVSNNNITITGLPSGIENISVVGGVNLINNNVVRNNIVTIDNTNLGIIDKKTASVIGGASIISGATVENNKVTITKGKIGYEVYGGVALNGTAQKNTVYIEEGYAFLVTGGYGSNATSNNVTIIGSNINTSVYGGESEGIHTNNNKDRINIDNNIVNISGASNITNNTLGGYLSNYYNASNASISNNTVIIENDDGEIGLVAGGYAENRTKGFISENTVEYVGGNATTVAGGYGESNFTGNVTGNKVSVSGGNIEALYGGFIGNNTISGEVSFNEVYLSGSGNATDIYGGHAGNSSRNNVFNNTVAITDGEAVNVYGGAAGENYTGNVTYNIVDISGGNVSGNITGGFVDKDSKGSLISYNEVYVSGLTDNVTNIYGAYAGDNSTENVTLNKVAIDGIEVTGDVYGGRSSKGKADNNTVEIANAVISGSIYGGYSLNSSAAGNIINLTNVNVTGNVTAGYNNITSTSSTAKINASTDNNSVYLYGAEIGDSILGVTGSNNSVYVEAGLNNISGSVNISGELSITDGAINIYKESKIGKITISGGESLFNSTTDVNGSVSISGGVNKFIKYLNTTGGLIISGAGESVFNATDVKGVVNISGGVNNFVDYLNVTGATGAVIISDGKSVFNATIVNGSVSISGGANEFAGDLNITGARGDIIVSGGNNTFGNITTNNSSNNITISASNNTFNENIQTNTLTFDGGSNYFNGSDQTINTNANSPVVAKNGSQLYIIASENILTFNNSLVIKENSGLNIQGTGNSATLAVEGNSGLELEGTLDLGTNGLDVTGNVTFKDGATFKFDYNATSGAQGYLSATENINIDEGDIVKVEPTNIYAVDDTVNIIEFVGKSDWTIENFDSVFLKLEFDDSEYPTGIYANVKQADEIIDTLSGLTGDTHNKHELAILTGKLESSIASATGAKRTALRALYEKLMDRFVEAYNSDNPVNNVDRLLREATGEAIVSAQAAVLETVIKAQGVVFKRLDQIHASMVATPPSAGSEDTFNRAWVGGFGSWARQKDRDGIYGYDYNSGGISLGYDHRAEGISGLRFGIVTSFSFGKIDNNSGWSEVDVDTAGVGIYGSYLLDNGLFIDANFAYAQSKNESKVFTLGGGYKKGDFDIGTWQIGTQAGMIFDLGSFKLTPTVGLRYLSVDQDAFRERAFSGSGAVLNYFPKKTDHIFEIP